MLLVNGKSTDPAKGAASGHHVKNNSSSVAFFGNTKDAVVLGNQMLTRDGLEAQVDQENQKVVPTG